MKIIANSDDQARGDQIEYLKAEIKISGKRIDFTPGERARLTK